MEGIVLDLRVENKKPQTHIPKLLYPYLNHATLSDRHLEREALQDSASTQENGRVKITEGRASVSTPTEMHWDLPVEDPLYVDVGSNQTQTPDQDADS